MDLHELFSVAWRMAVFSGLVCIFGRAPRMVLLAHPKAGLVDQPDTLCGHESAGPPRALMSIFHTSAPDFSRSGHWLHVGGAHLR
jgi:hypothetical protein